MDNLVKQSTITEKDTSESFPKNTKDMEKAYMGFDVHI